MTCSDPKFSAFAQKHGEDAAQLMASRFDADRAHLERDVMDVYEQTLTPQELAALVRFYQTDEGRQIAKKLPMLDAKLAVAGWKHDLKVLDHP